MADYATITDMTNLWRTMTTDEQERATALIPIVCDSLRFEAKKVGKDLDALIAADATLASVTKSVTVDVVSRTLMTSTDDEPAISSSQSALGYSQSVNFLVPGGGLFIKKSELSRLGLSRQRYGQIDFYSEE